MGHQHDRADEPPEQCPEPDNHHHDDVDELGELEGDESLETKVEQPGEEPFGFYRIGLGAALWSARAGLWLATGWLGWGSQEPECEYKSCAYW
ncbi:hypothetical protein GCM10023190_22020 [Enteractinococcus fodinae]|uniref:Uncharacterized protein n=1 Tax=Enteractinococcus fodinae TaxID=684663 RepID=A0ABU2B6N3_9MICC|nr:hypothetical protein [Enteractinococcus fodinae]MDR7348039.1 hypothetical protein [Enteractinococcus fodinae]